MASVVFFSVYSDTFCQLKILTSTENLFTSNDNL